jgi:hypothetical protein
MTDASGRITYYNEAAATLWGRRPELGKSKWFGSWKLHSPDRRPLAHDECPMATTLPEPPIGTFRFADPSLRCESSACAAESCEADPRVTGQCRGTAHNVALAKHPLV